MQNRNRIRALIFRTLAPINHQYNLVNHLHIKQHFPAQYSNCILSCRYSKPKKAKSGFFRDNSWCCEHCMSGVGQHDQGIENPWDCNFECGRCCYSWYGQSRVYGTQRPRPQPSDDLWGLEKFPTEKYDNFESEFRS